MYIIKQKQPHRYREQTSGYQWTEGRGKGIMRVEIKRYKLLCIKYIRNMDILYVIGKQSLFCNNFKRNINYKNTESLCCTPKTNIL